MDKVMWFDIPVHDLDAGARFYGQVFGWDVLPRDPSDPGSALSFRMARTGPSADDGMPASAGAIHGGIVTRDIGITQPAVLIEVDDLDRALERVREAGGRQVTPPRALPLAGGAFAYFEDPDGNVSGLWQWSADPAAT